MGKVIVCCLAGVMSLGLLLGCGVEETQSVTERKTADLQNETSGSGTEEVEPEYAGGVTLTLMGNAKDLSKPYMERIISLYEEKTGNTIDMIALEDSTFDTVAADKFAAGDIPDIFQHFNNSALNNFAVSDNFYYLNEEAWVSDLTLSAEAYSKDSEGNVLGLPFWESSVSGCYYNRTLFEELGLEPATTQAEFDELCEELMAAGVTPLCWPTVGCNWMYQFGLDPVFADDSSLLVGINSNEITYRDIPAVKDMVRWLKDAADRGWFGSTYLTDNWNSISELVGSGEAGMVLIWDTWFSTDFDESYGYTAEDFSLMPVFLNTVEEGTYEGGNLNMLMVNRNGENLDTALEFLRFCADPQNYNEAFEGISTVSVFNGQTTHVQSHMVTDAMDSVNALQRASTTETKIIGYIQADTGEAIREMFLGNIDVEGCVERMDKSRIAAAKAMGTPGF